MANANVQYICSRFLTAEYRQMLLDFKNDNVDRMDLIHHLSSGFKSLFSQDVQDSILTIR